MNLMHMKIKEAARYATPNVLDQGSQPIVLGGQLAIEMTYIVVIFNDVDRRTKSYMWYYIIQGLYSFLIGCLEISVYICTVFNANTNLESHSSASILTGT